MSGAVRGCVGEMVTSLEKSNRVLVRRIGVISTFRLRLMKTFTCDLLLQSQRLRKGRILLIFRRRYTKAKV